MIRATLPDAAYLRECFDLDFSSGSLTWKVRPREHFRTARGWRTFNAQMAGKEAGAITPEGYRVVAINKRLFKAHRIVFSLAVGCAPEHEIDQRDGNPSNNAPSNLRDATPSQNQVNKAAWRGRSLPKGVYAKDAKFVAKLRKIGGETVYLGRFSTVDEAKSAHAAAVAKFHGEFGRVA